MKINMRTKRKSGVAAKFSRNRRNKQAERNFDIPFDFLILSQTQIKICPKLLTFHTTVLFFRLNPRKSSTLSPREFHLMKHGDHWRNSYLFSFSNWLSSLRNYLCRSYLTRRFFPRNLCHLPGILLPYLVPIRFFYQFFLHSSVTLEELHGHKIIFYYTSITHTQTLTHFKYKHGYKYKYIIKENFFACS